MSETELVQIEKRCPRCGAAFQCRQEAGCWCASVRVDAATLAELQARFSDCLCESCLRILAAGAEPDPAGV